MDVQLQELIDKIKKDGIESASKLAASMKQEAEAEAKGIIDAAKKEASAIVNQAEADARKFEQAGKSALEQASRNLVLAFRTEIQKLLDAIVTDEVVKAYDSESLKAIIPGVLQSWSSGSVDTLDVMLSEKDLKQLEDHFKTKLSDVLKKGVELKSDRNLGSGFRIASKDGSAYYDFSSEAVAELLSAYLNPKLAEILDSAVKEQ